MQILNRTKSLMTLLFIAAALFALVACSSSSSGGSAFVRVVHLSPDAPAVDVLLDDVIVLSDVSYPMASDYLGIVRGARNIKVNAAGTDVTVIEALLSFPENSRTTIIATGLLGSDDLEPLVLTDRTVEPAIGESLVRVVHGAPSAPAVDVYVTEPGVSLVGQSAVLENVPFRAVSDYLTLPAGDYQVRVTVAGTSTVAIDTGVLTVADGEVYTVVARENIGGGNPFAVLVLIDG